MTATIADVVRDHRAGTITVMLQFPYVVDGLYIAAITVGPFTHGIRRRWRNAEFKDYSSLFEHLLHVINCEDPITQEQLDAMHLDDSERCLTEFIRLVPEEISTSAALDDWPGRKKPAPEPEVLDPGIEDSTYYPPAPVAEPEQDYADGDRAAYPMPSPPPEDPDAPVPDDFSFEPED